MTGLTVIHYFAAVNPVFLCADDLAYKEKNMKYSRDILYSLLLITIMTALPGPVRGEGETILQSNLESGAYVGPAVKFSNIVSNPGTFVGFRGGWIINNTIVIGAAFYELIGNVDLRTIVPVVPDALSHESNYLGMRYGGVQLEYIHQHYRKIHLAGSLLLGRGSVGARGRNTLFIKNGDRTFFVAEPGLMLEFNILPYVRLNLGVSWRFIESFSSPVIDSSDIQGINGLLFIKHGTSGFSVNVIRTTIGVNVNYVTDNDNRFTYFINEFKNNILLSDILSRGGL
jgi:hypothetical protein